jgi:hypothetical protein
MNPGANESAEISSDPRTIEEGMMFHETQANRVDAL